jgi:flagellar biosynthetic protein FlhB
LLSGLAGGLAAIWVQLNAAGQGPLLWFAHALRATTPDLPGAAAAILQAALPSALAASLAAACGTLLQTGFLIRPGALRVDLGRVSPGSGLKRMVSADTLMQAVKSTLKLAVLAAALWSVLRTMLPLLRVMPGVAASGFLPLVRIQIVLLAAPLVGAQLIIAGADLAYVRWQHARRMRMSRQDQRDEQKDSDGNPQIKQRLRQLARLRGRKRMMAAVAKATVVVTNPSHYAVALLYERGSRTAPRVVGKGADEVAARIREVAQANTIPMVANPPLARALYRVEIDTEIPAEHFKAVAEIVAYIWRLNRAADRPRPGRGR